MLSPEQIEAAGDAVAAVYNDIEAKMLDHMVNTLIHMDGLDQKSMTELVLLAQSQTTTLSSLIDKESEAISAEVRDAAERLIKASDDDDMRRLGTKSPIYPQQVDATIDGIANILARDNLKMVDGAKQAFLTATTEAVTRVNTGTMNTERALHSAVRKLEREGIPIITYQNSKTGVITVENKVDVAVRRHIRTQIAQDGARMTMERIKRGECTLVEVSSHEDSRPSHAEWQGQVYSLNGDVEIDGHRYRDFYEATRYGSVDGLLGANCRHSFGPYRHGTPRAYDPDPKHPSGLSGDEVYELEQQQRYLERRIREAKREVRGASQVHDKLDTLESRTALLKAKDKLSSAQGAMRDLIREANAKSKHQGVDVLHRRPNREWAGDMPKSKPLNASGRKLDEFLTSRAEQLKRAGISKTAMRKAISDELGKMGAKASDFSSLSKGEQDGIFKRLRTALGTLKKNHPKTATGKTPTKRYVPCKTKSDALDFANRELGFDSVSSSLTISELNELNEAFYRLIQANPFMRGFVRTIKTGKIDACAYFKAERVSKGSGKFAYEPVFKFDRTSLASASADCETLCKPSKVCGGNAWWSKKHDSGGIVAHEFTHAIECKVTMKRVGILERDVIGVQEIAAFNREYGTVSKEIVEEAFSRAGVDYNDANVMKHVSVYGNENTRETLAEALSCEDRGNAVCNAIKDVTRELLEKEGLL